MAINLIWFNLIISINIGEQKNINNDINITIEDNR